MEREVQIIFISNRQPNSENTKSRKEAILRALKTMRARGGKRVFGKRDKVRKNPDLKIYLHHSRFDTTTLINRSKQALGFGSQI